jgi:hypothetical protein
MRNDKLFNPNNLQVNIGLKANTMQSDDVGTSSDIMIIVRIEN